MLLKMNDYIQSVPEFIGKSLAYLKNKIEIGLIFHSVFRILFEYPPPPYIFVYLILTCWNINLIILMKNQISFFNKYYNLILN